jgi:hypothetical protein
MVCYSTALLVPAVIRKLTSRVGGGIGEGGIRYRWIGDGGFEEICIGLT